MTGRNDKREADIRRRKRSFSAISIAAAVLVCLAALGYLIFDGLPSYYVARGALPEEAWLKARNDVRTAAIQAIGGAALLVGAVFTARTFRLSKEEQYTGRFQRAAECLGSHEIPVRIGAIYALERLARDSRKDQGPIMEILCSYVRNGTIASDAQGYPPDLQAAVTVLGRRATHQDPPEFIVDLSGSDLTGAILARANFDGATFVRASLRGAVLADSLLRKARFIEAEMEGISLIGAQLQDARLGGAKMQHSALYEANFTNADLHEANLVGAQFSSLGPGSLHAFAARAISNTVGAVPARFGLDTSDAKLVETNMASASYSLSTRWPRGFDLAKSGASLVRE